jgi:preprotein translocase subunit SecF
MFWPFIKLLPVKTNLDFVGFARAAAALSIIAVIATAVGLFKPGLNFGIDFKGGTVLELNTGEKPVNLSTVRSTLGALNLGDVQVQAFGAPNDALIRFQTPEGSDPAQTVGRVKTALNAAIGPVTYSRTEVVGPKVSGELFRNGITALGVAIGLMLLYIWFRFELQFGLGAVVALFHFIYVWNDFLAPLIFLTHRDDFTLALGLQMYQSRAGNTPWNLLMAAGTMVVAPVLVLFFLTQRQFVRGIASGGGRE